MLELNADLSGFEGEADPALGRFVPAEVEVTHRYVVDEPQKEGVDEEGVPYLVEEERGHWETLRGGEPEPRFDGCIPAGSPRDADLPGTWPVLVWTPWSDAELAERAQAEVRRREAEAAAIAREAWLAQAPGAQESCDDAICALYEAQLAYQEEQDAAICALYEMMEG